MENFGSLILPLLLSALVGYLLGSISFAILLTKAFAHEDVRAHGSGNAGATNVLRVAGKKSLCADVSARFLQVCCERFGRLFSCKARVRCKRRGPRNGAPWHVCGGLLLHDRPHVPAVLRLPRRQGRCDHGGDDAFARLARVPHLLCGVPFGVPEKSAWSRFRLLRRRRSIPL